MDKIKKAFRPTDEVIAESVAQGDVKHQAGQDPDRDAVTVEAKFERECQRCADAVLSEPTEHHKDKVSVSMPVHARVAVAHVPPGCMPCSGKQAQTEAQQANAAVLSQAHACVSVFLWQSESSR